MVKTLVKVLEINVKTGERKEYETECDFPDEPYVEPIGIDQEKLKQVLLDAGIITDKKQIEPDVKVIQEPIT